MFTRKNTRRIEELEATLARVLELGPQLGRALNNEARISLLEQRFNEAQTLGLPPARLRANE